MKYSTVRIQPTIKGNWEVSFSDDPTERVDGEGNMSGLGFFHYPSTLSRSEAFEKLKQRMGNDHNDEIIRLEKSLFKLERLNLEDF